MTSCVCAGEGGVGPAGRTLLRAKDPLPIQRRALAGRGGGGHKCQEPPCCVYWRRRAGWVGVGACVSTQNEAKLESEPVPGNGQRCTLSSLELSGGTKLEPGTAVITQSRGGFTAKVNRAEASGHVLIPSGALAMLSVVRCFWKICRKYFYKLVEAHCVFPLQISSVTPLL